MSQGITVLPDKIAERKSQIESRLAQLAYRRLQNTLANDKIDDEVVTLESRYAELKIIESVWSQHTAIAETRRGDLVEPPRKDHK